MKGSGKHGKKLKGKAAKRNAKRDSRNASPGPSKPGKPGARNGKPTGSKGKQAMSGTRRGELHGNLRFEPVVFVAGQHEFELKLDLPQSEETSEESSLESSEHESSEDELPVNELPVNGASASDNGAVELPVEETSSSEDEEIVLSVAEDGSSSVEGDNSMADETDLATNEPTEPNVPTKEPLPLEHTPEMPQNLPDSDEELLGSMSDDELDAMIDQEISGNSRQLEVQMQRDPVVDDTVDSDIDSVDDFEAEPRTAHDGRDIVFSSDSDEAQESAEDLEESEEELEVDSEEEPEEDEESEDDEDNRRLRITLDDYDLSDADSATQDYLDNMSDLDDDQIFALASGSLKKKSIQDFEDMDVFDQYDEYDEYFDQLLERDEGLGPINSRARVSDRKKLKRQAREMMHAMKFGKQPLLWQRYPEEIHVREVLAELRNFSNQSGASLAFPPLDNNANWYVKQLSELHGMRPTVEGQNMQKYVVAHRTRRTTAISGKGLNKLLTRRQVFRRSDLKEDKKKSKKEKGGSGKPGGARVSHGHVVGQNASEISQDNIGHRLMRQMGWTEGSGLGKERKGITVPISAMVKLTKTGLGQI